MTVYCQLMTGSRTQMLPRCSICVQLHAMQSSAYDRYVFYGDIALGERTYFNTVFTL